VPCHADELGYPETRDTVAMSNGRKIHVMRWAAAVATILAIATWCVHAGTPAQAPNPVGLLDKYAASPQASSFETLSDDQLKDFLNALKRDGPAWVNRSGADTARRRVIFAALVLEASDATRVWRRIEYDQVASVHMGRQIRALVEDACELVRLNPVTERERLWFLASVAMIQGSGDLTLLAGKPDVSPGHRRYRHLDHALAALPDEPRLKLAQAETNEDWYTMGERLTAGTNTLHQLPQGARGRIFSAMEALYNTPAVAPEAHLHVGFQHVLLGQPGEALEEFHQAAASDDPFVTYLAHFIAGRVLDRERQGAGGADQYALALKAIPHTPSAVESLAIALITRGEGERAAALVKGMFDARASGTAPDSDPWTLFNQGDYRRFPDLMRTLRTSLRP
jgi:hypothetical protein